MIRILALALLLCAALPVTAADPAKAERDTQKIVYMADGAPLLIQMHLRIDGESFRARHRALLDSLFDYLDRDGDGVLNRAEARAAPPAQSLVSPLALFGRRAEEGPRLVPESGDKVTRDGLAAHYSRTGLPPFQIGEFATPVERFAFVRTASQFNAEQVTDRLFKLLDADRDGKLSRKELEAAPAILGGQDIDEDELLTDNEVMGSSSNYSLPFAATRRMPATVEPRLLLAVNDSGPNEQLGKVLLERYGKRSLAEWSRFGDSPADILLTVHLGNRKDGAAVKWQERPLPPGVEVKASGESMGLHLKTSRLDLSVPQNRADFNANVSERVRGLFRQADSNGDSSLDRAEARVNGFFLSSFEAMDRDGDDKVSEKELLAYYQRMEAFSKQAARSCVSMTLDNQGKGMFDLLDANGDGRLSIRELRKAHQVLAKLDTDGDGQLARTEVPRHHKAVLALGPLAGQELLGRIAVAAPRRDASIVRPAAGRGPLWFQKMDRNRDGDVSRKEFVGTAEQFREIDSDGDGLITAEEAQQLDARKRAGKE